MSTNQKNVDKVVIVTGAAQGMGEAVAKRALAEGYRVIAVDRDARVQELTSDRLKAYTADVADAAAAQEILTELVAEGAILHGLVNVAGIHRVGTVLTASSGDWDDIMRVNLFGTINWIQAVLPFMVKGGQGSIVNFASVAATRARPESAVYAVSKSAVLGLTRSIALDFGADGVRCNAVSPGSIDTPMYRAAMDAAGTSLEDQLSVSPLGRVGTVDEIAGTVNFLLSDDSAYLNGADVMVDGGRTVKV